jgi:hypothetical protein
LLQLVFLTKILISAKGEFTQSDLLSPGGFAYIFPLLAALIHRVGRTNTLKEKMRTELAMFASDILLSHCGLGGSPMVPRRDMVHSLVELLSRYPRLHGAAREGLLTLCVSMEDAAADLMDESLDDDMNHILESDEKAIVEELLDATLNSEPIARESSLKALLHLPIPQGSIDGVAAARVWVSRFDGLESISSEADRVWEMWNEESNIESPAVPHVMSLISKSFNIICIYYKTKKFLLSAHNVSDVRISAGKSLCSILELMPDKTHDCVKLLFSFYDEKVLIYIIS